PLEQGSPAPIASLIADGVHVAPAMVRLAWRLLCPPQGEHRLALLTDAMAPAASDVARAAGPATFAGKPVEVRDGALRAVEEGRLVGSVLSMSVALANLGRFAGVSLAEALPAATSTPARAAGLVGRGLIAPGQRADLLVLEGSAVTMTMIAGEIVHPA